MGVLLFCIEVIAFVVVRVFKDVPGNGFVEVRRVCVLKVIFVGE